MSERELRAKIKTVGRSKLHPVDREALSDREKSIELTSIASTHLHVETLETRNSDSLDFHDVTVWGIKAALEAAYVAGKRSERNSSLPF